MKTTEEKTVHAVAPEQVMAYLDGELSAEEAEAVAAHLRECGYCAVVAEELGGVSRELRAWAVEEAPARLEREIRRASLEVGAKPRRRISRKVWAWGGALTAVAVLFVIGVQMSAPKYNTLPSAAMMARSDAYVNQPQTEGALRGYAYDGQNMAQLAQIAPGLTTATAPPPPIPRKADRFTGAVESLGTGPLMPMIARTASLTVLVKNVADARASLESLMTRDQGYAAQLTFSTPDGGARSLQASLRVPSGQLPAALESLRKLGRVEEEAQSGEEVTAQHADLVARLTNAREEEARLRSLLVQRTGKIEDVLQVEEEIARVRGEIEQMEAEQKGLEHRVDFASVELKLVEEYAARLESPAEGTGTRMHNAFVAGIQNAGSSLLGLVLFTEEYGPVLLIWGAILGVPAWLGWRRYQKARASIR
jgi:anti-sigma factor RsiW